MRLDKYLKISKLIKRRPVATLMCNEGKIKIDERIGKAGSTVQTGQIIEVNMGKKIIKVKITLVPEKNYNIHKSDELYEFIEEIFVQEI